MAGEAYQIAKCKEIIEKKLAWGASDHWQGHDFEALSEKVFEETKVMLSSSTLKRIWGKVRYDSKPNMATLNALAQFAGYQNWRTFTATGLGDSLPNSVIAARPVFKMPYKALLAIGGLALVLIVIGFGLSKKQSKQLHFEKLLFTSKPVTIGLPNTVIFQYDATNSNADSVLIQQSWDPRKRHKVDKQLHEYTSTYYYPGYYRAKLILNDSVVKEHDVYIATDGWVGLIEKNPAPIYLPKEMFEKELSLAKDQLSGLNIDLQKEAPVFTLTKVDSAIRIMSDRFSLIVRLQNTYQGSDAICRHTNVLVMGTTGVISVPLCKIGCVGEVGLMLGKNYIDGKTHDLSGFGVDFSKEVRLDCETKNQILKLSVNERVVYVGDFKVDIGKIVGAQIRFNGTGAVRQFELKENK